MLEEYLSTVTVSSLTGEVKDVLIDEDVGFSGDDEAEIVDDARENSDGFHSEILSGLSSVIHVGCLGKSHERRPLLGIGFAPITPFGAGLAGLEEELLLSLVSFLLFNCKSIANRDVLFSRKRKL